MKEDHGHGDGHYHGDGHGHDEVSFVKAVYLIPNIKAELNCLYAEICIVYWQNHIIYLLNYISLFTHIIKFIIFNS